MFEIITIGSAAKDIFLQGIDFVNCKSSKFKTGEGICLGLASKNNVSEADLFNGGSAVNTAITFSRRGLKTGAIFRVGNDLFGEDIRNFLRKERIDINFSQKDRKISTALSVILLKNGERTILAYKGVGKNISEKEISWKKIKTKWFYVGTLTGNKKLLEKILATACGSKIKHARKGSFSKGVKIAGNPSMADLKILKANPKLLENYDVFLVNQEEASYLTGIPYQKEKEIFKKLDKLVDGIVVMTKGVKGVSVSDGKNIYKAGVFPQKAYDRTGAGDAFGSGFVVGLMRTGKIKEGIRLGLANAASVVEKLGANTGILTKIEFNRDKRWKRI